LDAIDNKNPRPGFPGIFQEAKNSRELSARIPKNPI